MINLTFYGATKQVTGSMYLIETPAGKRILVECGWEADRDRSWEAPQTQEDLFPFVPSTIDAVFITHAHIDHSGKLPLLVRNGFTGPIYCTHETLALVHILLMDSAGLHARKLYRIASEKKNKNKSIDKLVTPDMYFSHHVEESMSSFKPVYFNQKVRIDDETEAYFNETGHLLGAANLVFSIKDEGKTKKIGFSGDLGRSNYPLLNDPKPMEQVDYLVCESTYGGRYHQDNERPEEILFDIFQKTCVDIPGKLIIPAFSVGRTQALLFTLNKLFREYDLPRVKVFADSPMAMSSTEVYEDYLSSLNTEAQNFHDKTGQLFDFENLELIRDLNKSKRISRYQDPCVIISASGMISGGRIENHVKYNLSNPFASFFFIGYTAEGTLGHEIQFGDGSINMFGKKMPIRAKIGRTDVFSGHGDQNDLISFVNQQDRTRLRSVFLIHGEESSMTAFKELLNGEGYDHVHIPDKNETFEL